jgi:hypothetical protein
MTSDTHTINFISNLFEYELTATKTNTLSDLAQSAKATSTQSAESKPLSSPLGLDITMEKGKQVLETIRKNNLAQKAVY